MPLAREQRKLAAIVAADVVGYSRLMGRDESGTLARLRKNRTERLDPVLKKYGGRLRYLADVISDNPTFPAQRERVAEHLNLHSENVHGQVSGRIVVRPLEQIAAKVERRKSWSTNCWELPKADSVVARVRSRDC